MKKSPALPVALITGASRGLGASIARFLVKSGFRVVVHYRRNATGARQLARSLPKEQTLLISGDLSAETEAKAVLKKVQKTWGRLDLLINNAGTYSSRPLDKISAADWQEGLDSTATATFFTTRAALPLLRRSPHGRIINIGDSSCDRPTARDLAISYHIGKTGVLILTRSFAAAEARYGITVNMISPGWLENSQDLPAPSTIPAGRHGKFKDFHQAIEFLICPESSYLTGSNLVVSGGWNLR